MLCIDEFKNLETEEGKYAVLLYDPNNKKIIDIIEDRKLESLDEYFYHIPLNELENVKYFVSDMYEGYRSVKKRFFNNATHIVDGFHFSRYVTGALNSIRIDVMNSLDKSTPEYRTLKKYWHLYLKRLKDIREYEQYNPIQKKKTRASEIITDSLEVNEMLYNAFLIKEEFFNMEEKIHFETRNETLNNLIEIFKNSNFKEYIAVANMFKNWFDEIANSYIRFGDRRLNNGYIEGMNNRIKEIKKISYGFKSFYYLRNRVMFIINENEPITKVDKSKIPVKKRH